MGCVAVHRTAVDPQYLVRKDIVSLNMNVVFIGRLCISSNTMTEFARLCILLTRLVPDENNAELENYLPVEDERVIEAVFEIFARNNRDSLDFC